MPFTYRVQQNTHICQRGDSEGRCTSVTWGSEWYCNKHPTDASGLPLHCAEQGVSASCASLLRHFAYLTARISQPVLVRIMVLSDIIFIYPSLKPRTKSISTSCCQHPWGKQLPQVWCQSSGRGTVLCWDPSHPSGHVQTSFTLKYSLRVCFRSLK